MDKPHHVYKLQKALYGLKQAPRAWYERLSTFLVARGYNRGNVDPTLFTRRSGKDILVAQVYVDDIIFGSTNYVYCSEFSELMKGEFEMSLMGELTFFLGLQVRQLKEGLHVSQTKYTLDLLKKYGYEKVKSLPTPMSSSIKLDSDESGKPVDPTLYRGMIGSLLYLCASRPDI